VSVFVLLLVSSARFNGLVFLGRPFMAGRAAREAGVADQGWRFYSTMTLRRDWLRSEVRRGWPLLFLRGARDNSAGPISTDDYATHHEILRRH